MNEERRLIRTGIKERKIKSRRKLLTYPLYRKGFELFLFPASDRRSNSQRITMKNQPNNERSLFRY